MFASRVRRLTAFASPALAIVAVLAAAPAAHAAPAPATAVATAGPIELAHRILPVDYPAGLRRGTVEIWIWSDHTKRLKVCDTRGDERSPTLQVDLAGPLPELEYQDPDGSVTNLCYDSYFEPDYPIQKFRLGFHEQGSATVALWWGPWFNREMLPGVPSWPW